MLDLTEDGAPSAAMAGEATVLVQDAVETLLRDSFSGVLWLYPAAVSSTAVKRTLEPQKAETRAAYSSSPPHAPCAVSTSAVWRGT